MPADIAIYDPDYEWVVSPSTLISQGKHTPFVGYPLQGKVSATVVAGQVVYENSVHEPA